MIIQTLLIAFALLITFFLLKKQRNNAASKDDDLYQIKFDRNKLELIFPDGTKQDLGIADITLITIKTTDQGPVEPDLFWQFHTHYSEAPTMIIPEGAIGEEDLLAFLGTALPTFDYEHVISATGSTENALFVIWSKDKEAK